MFRDTELPACDTKAAIMQITEPTYIQFYIYLHIFQMNISISILCDVPIIVQSLTLKQPMDFWDWISQ